MIFRYRLDNNFSRKSRLSACPIVLSLTSFFLLGVSVCAPIAGADDEPAAVQLVSTSDPSLRSDSINWFGDPNAMESRCRDFLPTIQSIAMPIGGVPAVRENEFFPAFLTESAAANTANTSSAIFKTERWRTNKVVIASSIFEAAWLTADGITTAEMSRGAREAGSAWAYGRHPTPGRTAGMMAAEFVGVEASSYVLHKMKAPKWVYIAPMVGSGSFHASGAIPNMRIGQ
jgi:hypothetical protein